MAFDIYGNHLRSGHCEVHPHVHEEYPCSVCYSESENKRKAKQLEADYYRQQEANYYKSLEAELGGNSKLTLTDRIRHAYPSLSAEDVEQIVKMVRDEKAPN